MSIGASVPLVLFVGDDGVISGVEDGELLEEFLGLPLIVWVEEPFSEVEEISSGSFGSDFLK